MEINQYLGRAQYLRDHMSKTQPCKRMLGDVWAWLSVGLGTCITYQAYEPKLVKRCNEFADKYFHAMNFPLSEKELSSYHSEAASLLDDLLSRKEHSSTEDSRELVSVH